MILKMIYWKLEINGNHHQFFTFSDAYISAFSDMCPLIMVKSACLALSRGVLVFDNKDIHLQATYIWVKAVRHGCFRTNFGKAKMSHIGDEFVLQNAGFLK